MKLINHGLRLTEDFPIEIEDSMALKIENASEIMVQLLANAYICLPLYEVKWVLFKWVFAYVKLLITMPLPTKYLSIKPLFGSFKQGTLIRYTRSQS